MSTFCGACGGVLSPTTGQSTVAVGRVERRYREYLCDICGFRVQVVASTAPLSPAFTAGGAER
jgi:hypothetical protein